MVIKINLKSPYTPGDWYEYFFKQKKKDTTQMRILRENFKHCELNYPFLDETQHWGRVYQFLGIPQICGKVDKVKLRKIYNKEKKFNPRKNKLNVEIKHFEKNNTKDYRDIVKKTGLFKTKCQLNEDRIQIQRKKEADLQTTEIKPTLNKKPMDKQLISNINETELDSKKTVRFKNVQILCFDKSISSDSEFDSNSLFDFLCNTSNKRHTEKNYQPYFQGLNDSFSNESITESDGNNNDTGILSPIYSSDEKMDIFSQNKPAIVRSYGKEKKTILHVVEIKSRNSDDEKSEIDSDSIDNDNDTGIISPLTVSDEEFNVKCDNETSNWSPKSLSNEELEINSVNLTNGSPKQNVEEIINKAQSQDRIGSIQTVQQEYTEKSNVAKKGITIDVKLERSRHSRSTPETSNVQKAELTNFQDLPTIFSDLKLINSQEISRINQKDTEIIRKKSALFFPLDYNPPSTKKLDYGKQKENEDKTHKLTTSISLANNNCSLPTRSTEFERNKIIEEENLQDAILLNSSSNSFTTTASDDGDLHFIPNRTLIYPKIDHLDDYRLSSSSGISNVSFDEVSLIQQELGFGSTFMPKKLISNDVDEEVQNTEYDENILGSDEGSLETDESVLEIIKDVFSNQIKNKDINNLDKSKEKVQDIICTSYSSELSNKENTECLQIISESESFNLENILQKSYNESRNKSVNSNEMVNEESNIIQMNANKENIDFSKLIPESESGSSENILQTSFNNELLQSKRESLKLITNNSFHSIMENFTRNKVLPEESKENEVSKSLQYESSRFNRNITTNEENFDKEIYSVSSSNEDILPPSYNSNEKDNEQMESDHIINCSSEEESNIKANKELNQENGNVLSDIVTSSVPIENKQRCNNIFLKSINRFAEIDKNKDFKSGLDIFMANLKIDSIQNKDSMLSKTKTQNQNKDFILSKRNSAAVKQLIDNSVLQKEKETYFKSNYTNTGSVKVKNTSEFDYTNMIEPQREHIVRIDNKIDSNQPARVYTSDLNVDAVDDNQQRKSSTASNIITSSSFWDCNNSVVNIQINTEDDKNIFNPMIKTLIEDEEIRMCRNYNVESCDKYVLNVETNMWENKENSLTDSAMNSNQFNRKAVITDRMLLSHNEEHDADTSSDESVIAVLHNKLKRKKKKITGGVRHKKFKLDTNKSPDKLSTSDDMEIIQNVQDVKNKFINKFPFKKTTVTNTILIQQNIEDNLMYKQNKLQGKNVVNFEEKIDLKHDDKTKNKNSSSSVIGSYDSIGAQRISQEIEFRKTSIVKQLITQTSSDTSTTNEFITSALARRIYYLNK